VVVNAIRQSTRPWSSAVREATNSEKPSASETDSSRIDSESSITNNTSAARGPSGLGPATRNSS
jgi:hypothetical protein